jgi:hypothetical protein
MDSYAFCSECGHYLCSACGCCYNPNCDNSSCPNTDWDSKDES